MLSESVVRPATPASLAVTPAALSSIEVTPTEVALRDIWREVFANPAITVDDDFYELDGYSLLAARIALRVRESFGVELPLDEIYRAPTVREVAAYIEGHLSGTSKHLLNSAALVLLKAGQAGPPLFFLHGSDGISSHYLRLVQRLACDYPMVGVDSPNLKGDQLAPQTLAEMAAFCLAEMRKLQAQGPYWLVGYSWSGLLAFETAQQLRAAGEEVALLAVIDTMLRYNPGAPLPLRLWEQKFGRQTRRYTGRVRGYVIHKAALLRHAAGAADRHSVPAAPSKATRRAEVELLGDRREEIGTLTAGQYRPLPYAGRIAYFATQLGRGALMGNYQRQAWSFLARGGIDIYELPGTHSSIMQEPLLDVTAEALTASIRSASTPANVRT